MHAQKTLHGINADAVRQCNDCKTYQGAAPTPERFVKDYKIGGADMTIPLCGKCAGDRAEKGLPVTRVAA